AEYRLLLRADNADQRLTAKGVAIGVVRSERARVFAAKEAALLAGRELLTGFQATPNELAKHGISVNQDGVRRSAADLLCHPDIDLPRMSVLWPALTAIESAIVQQLEIDGKYAGYLDRQKADIDAFRKDEALILPVELDYLAVGGLSAEMRAKLDRARPATLGAASRIPGVTPAALIALLRHVRNTQAGNRKTA
ncbi:MAG: tRNA uridine-5-carboxymethylaminomethyl(34) synthesis enzyme MnmG, partial [Alphaproteobacteria bacterium]|nr:tRNA uridine-5-carboxymethylaminomethyl(34) synthesis enzyme MnmG [Alphaproteobacteria bacterium]